MKLSKFFKSSATRAYWWKGVNNFGDALAPLLLARFAYLPRVEWSSVADAEIVSIGSILEQIPKGWTGYILGTGRHRDSEIKFRPQSAKIGDPGILANELIGRQEKRWDLGIVPHWRDQELAPRFLRLIPKRYSCRVISPRLDPIQVIEDIAACHRIVTSSLHGMIVADAIGGIPRRVEYCKKFDEESEGGDFKFRDYSASIRHALKFGEMSEPSRVHINEIKFGVFDAYRELSRAYGKS
jgi:pyruvyltransferase